MRKLIVITGCTATGKTSLSVELAKRLNGEIISADSMQIYQGMDIGTAKVTSEESSGIPHHMIDIVHPNTRFTVAEYQEMALKIIDDIYSRGKTPIIVGGTGLYINSLIYKMTFSDYDVELKNRIREMSESVSKQELWNYLYSLDKNRANELSVNDVKRVSRAIEIALSNTKAIEDETKIRRFDSRIYILNGDRSDIYDRINLRVDIMIKNNLIGEVMWLLNEGIKRDSQAIQGIGYKEITDYLDGNCTLIEAIELVKRKSRNYAKRQLTWFKRYYPDATYLDYKNKEQNIQQIIEDYHE